MTSIPVGCPLTQRQFECVEALAMGKRSKQIAAELGLGNSTVTTHLSKAYKRLGVVNAVQAVRVMYAKGWMQTTHSVLHQWFTATEQGRLSAAQQLYIEMFDRHLKERSQESRDRMSHTFVSMCYERDVPDRRGTAKHGPMPLGPLARLLRDVLAEPELNIRIRPT